MDFILETYKQLLESLLAVGYSFQTIEDFSLSEQEKVVMLRHDVDQGPSNALKFAEIEHSLNIRGTYYFRIKRKSNKPNFITRIVELDHEIGYHYEDLTINNGNREIAYQHFIDNLEYFRKFYPVRTCCMHGSPLSKWDNREIWNSYDYKTLGIIAEPYMDINFDRVFYLTDTGRRWDGDKYNVRDKVNFNPGTVNITRQNTLIIKKTNDIIVAAEKNILPEQLMITVHPQRWTSNRILWLQELVSQNFKNSIKKLFYVKNK